MTDVVRWTPLPSEIGFFCCVRQYTSSPRADSGVIARWFREELEELSLRMLLAIVLAEMTSLLFSSRSNGSLMTETTILNWDCKCCTSHINLSSRLQSVKRRPNISKTNRQKSQTCFSYAWKQKVSFNVFEMWIWSEGRIHLFDVKDCPIGNSVSASKRACMVTSLPLPSLPKTSMSTQISKHISQTGLCVVYTWTTSVCYSPSPAKFRLTAQSQTCLNVPPTTLPHWPFCYPMVRGKAESQISSL